MRPTRNLLATFSAMLFSQFFLVPATFANESEKASAEGSEKTKEDPSIATEPDQSCAQGSDPYDVPSRISSNSRMYADQCVNSEHFRPAKILLLDENHLVVANFLHQGVFHTADIPIRPEAWRRAFHHTLRFKTIDGVHAAHLQTRMQMAEGHVITLKPQVGNGPEVRVRNIIYSEEAAFPKDVSYNFLAGAIPNYADVGRLLSAEQRLSEGRADQKTEQHVLNFTPERVARMVVQAAQRSEAIGFKNFYNTLTNNCATGVFEIYDSDFPLDARPRPYRTQVWVDPVAGPALKALRDRGFLGPRYADMNDEFQTGATAPPAEPAPERHSGILRPQPNAPFTLVSLVPNGGPKQKISSKILVRARDLVTSSAPRLTQSVLIPVFFGGGFGTATLAALRQVYQEFSTFLLEVNADLPEEPTPVLISIVPWSGPVKPKGLNFIGLAADVPLETADFIGTDRPTTSETLRQITKDIQGLQNHEWNAPGDVPMFLLGLQIRLTLQKNKSSMTTQIALGLVPLERPFSNQTPQVNFTRFQIPLPYNPKLKPTASQIELMPKPTLIISHRQSYYQRFERELDFQFGEFGLVDTNPAWTQTWGLFNQGNNEGWVGCDARHSLAPQLLGQLSPNPVGVAVDWLLGGQDLRLSIYGFKLVDAKSSCLSIPVGTPGQDSFCEKAYAQKSGVMIRDVDVRAKVYVNGFEALSCLPNSGISNEVATAANRTLDEKAAEAIERSKEGLMEALTAAIPALKSHLPAIDPRP